MYAPIIPNDIVIIAPTILIILNISKFQCTALFNIEITKNPIKNNTKIAERNIPDHRI